MIALSTLTEQDLAIYNKRIVLICGFSSRIHVFIEILRYYNVKKVAFYSPVNLSPKDAFLIRIKGVHIVKPTGFKEFVETNSDLILQYSCSHAQDDLNTQKTVNQLGVEISDLSMGEVVNVFLNRPVFKTLKNSFKNFAMNYYWKYSCQSKKSPALLRLKKANIKEAIVLCLPQKTADFSLIRTFNKINQKNEMKPIQYANTWHTPRLIAQPKVTQNFDKIKIITAIREPIGQNLSAFYQILSESKIGYNWMYGVLEGKTIAEKKQTIESVENFLQEHGNDVQLLWEAYLNRFIPVTGETKRGILPSTIQEFVLEFQKHIVDITAYPFDKEKGYTIIRKDKIEIFVYQLEKLNSLVPELSAWIGVPFETLEKGNAAEDKWIAISYKQAQKEIEITQEYFDKCFDEPYVKHCYSAADIKKFKTRWSSHIKK